MPLTGDWTGLLALATFVAAYAAIVAEGRLQLRKSVPMLAAAGVLWVLVGIGLAGTPEGALVGELARRNILDYGELFLFLIVAMTYVNTLEERRVFDQTRAWLTGLGLSLRGLFWATGAIAFLLSSIADNLTTALVIGAVAIAVGEGYPRFVTLACINVVVAANAGGAFSPFGDVTTLMVWQDGVVPFFTFFRLFLPSLVNWLVPAALMTLAIGPARPRAPAERVELEAGAVTVGLLFLATIGLTVVLNAMLRLPPAIGMMAGLGALKLYSYGFNRAGRRAHDLAELDEVFARPELAGVPTEASGRAPGAGRPPGGARRGRRKPLDTFRSLERVEWDTLMFFYGVILGVGALGAFGYLRLASRLLYAGMGPTVANVLIGLLSAVVDNVPVMFAVLSMRPEMSLGDWTLVTLTVGVGGSLLSFGSAAGVALMGLARGQYTFATHLRWSWAVGLGYGASVATHLVLNRDLFR